MKSLFNRYEGYNNAGMLVSDEIQKAISPIMKKWADKDYRVKDIEAIISDITSLKNIIIIATKTLQMKKKEQSIN